MMKLSRRERFYGLIAALVLGILFLDQVVVGPGLARWEELGTQIAQADRDLDQARKIVTREKEIQTRWEALKGRMKPVKENFDNALFFVDHLWQLAATAGTSFSKTEERKRVDPRGEFNEISFDVRLQCNIQSLCRFIYELDASPELLKVRRIQITARPTRTTALDVDVQLSTIEPAPIQPVKKASHDAKRRS